MPGFRRLPRLCAGCHLELGRAGRGAPTATWCSGFDWVLHRDGRHFCFACADKIDERAHRTELVKYDELRAQKLASGRVPPPPPIIWGWGWRCSGRPISY